MRNRLPGLREWGVLAAMALVCTIIAAFSSKIDVALLLLGPPLFLVAALMGLNRKGELFTPREPVESLDAAAAGAANEPELD